MATMDDEFSVLSSSAKRALQTYIDEPGIDPFANVNRKFRGMLYGDPGCGKTVMAARIAALYGFTLVIDVEGSTESLIDHDDLRGKVEVKKFPGIRELTYALPRIVSGGKYKGLVVDSFTSMMDHEMKSILQYSGFSRPGSEDGAKELYTQQDYGLALNRVSWLMDVAGRADLAMILTGHVYEPNDKQIGQGQKRRLHGTHNQYVEVTSRVGNVFYVYSTLKDNERVFVAQTRTEGKVMAKTRINALPDHVGSAKLLDRLDAWRQGIEYKE